MQTAFWDSSSLILLCVRQVTTPKAQAFDGRYLKCAWWCTPVEMRGAISRLARMGQLSANGQVQALIRLDRLRRNWQEVEPSEKLREKAEALVERFSLKGADAF